MPLGWSPNASVAPDVLSTVLLKYLKASLVYPGKLGHPSSARIMVALQVWCSVSKQAAKWVCCLPLVVSFQPAAQAALG